MHYLFLLPLLTAIVTVYLARNSSDEIAYLMTLVAVGSLLLSLILAPWQIQLLLLITVVVIVTVLWQQRETEANEAIANALEETGSEKTYRGVTYTETQKEEIPAAEIEGKYRGVPVKISHNPSIASPIRPSALKYRGASAAGEEETP
jgi:membrane protein implicated in regulation of membrane protease activity